MNLDAFRALLSPAGEQLLARLGDHYDEARALATATALRREYPADLVATALTQARLRHRARAKFGDAAGELFFTPDGLEQATRPSVAALRADRYAALGARRIADLCCGIGGDLLTLAEAGPTTAVLGVDTDPLTCAVAEANVRMRGLSERVEIRCADVTTTELGGVDAAFLDPARRDGRGRVFDPKAYSPPWPFVAELTGRVPAVGVKVAPGIPHELIGDGVEAEWVSDRGEVKEAALWFGALAGTGGRHRATLLPSGASLTGTGTAQAPAGPVRRWLYEPDGAVIRAHLIAEVAATLDGTLVDPTIAYMTSDRLVATPFATCYEITDVMPFQLKRLRSALRERRIGSLTIKKRGLAVDPDELRRRLKPVGEETATVILTRAAGTPYALLARPVATAEAASAGLTAHQG